MIAKVQATTSEATDAVTIRIEGDLVGIAPGALGHLVDTLPPPDARPVVIDLTKAQRFGGIGVAAVNTLVGGLEERGYPVRLRLGDASRRRVLEAFGGDPEEPEDPEEASGDLVDRLGDRTLRVQDAAIRYLDILRRTLRSTFRQLFRPHRLRSEMSLRATIRMGVMATPLVAMISALIGAILALQTAPILQRFGQELLVTYVVGVSLTREIGPLLTAILIAGRSGSALTAEIGTMKVGEEVDALEAMGVDPVDYLVAPRLRAMIIVLPVLTMIADLVGTMGGMVIGVTALDLSWQSYLAETIRWVTIRDVLGGLIKAFFFGVVIISVAAHQGFSTGGGATGVGKFTTRSVVQAIMWIIVVDGVFTALLYALEP